MARRRTKKRTHLGAAGNGPPTKSKPISANQVSREPKSMVIRIGASDVGPSVSQLVKDIRQMMEPGTAARLKERKNNRLRDYVTMAGPLGVSHLLLLSRSESGNTNMRIAVTPRGPTLNFNVVEYSLCKDIRKALKHAKNVSKGYLHPPLLVMNNFKSKAGEQDDKIPAHLEDLVTQIFQGLFPPINPQSTPLSSIKRVLLLNRVKQDDGSFTIIVRHYAITTKATGLSRPLRRLQAAEHLINSQKSGKGLPNLGKMADIADFMIGGDAGEGYVTDATSGSDVDTDAEVEVSEMRMKKILTRRQREQTREDKPSSRSGVEKRAVKLIELGPRMKLRMTKVEEGVCSGKVMWHEFIDKTPEEIKAMDKVWEKRRQDKAARQRVQKENVERKKIAKKSQGEEEDDDEMVDEWDSEGLEGDGEMEVNERMDEEGDWEEAEEEIAAGRSVKS